MAVPLVDSCIGVISVSLCSGTFGFARLRSRFSFSADTISVVRYGSGLAVCVRGGRGVATVVLEAGEILRSLVGFIRTTEVAQTSCDAALCRETLGPDTASS